jgi:GNAT superfamily N-acetyltransferase
MTDSMPMDGRVLERVVARIDDASQSEVTAILSALSAESRNRLADALRLRETGPEPPGDRLTPYILRSHRSGDMGWVVRSHGLLYRAEYGWDERFEALVAEVVAHFIQNLDAERERCWIAERNGENIGSVFLVRHPEREGVAKLRLLLVAPKARGLGIGRRLVRECTSFARQAGYRTITLWTNSVLLTARKIYTEEGYRRVAVEPHDSLGHNETWELDLAPRADG